MTSELFREYAEHPTIELRNKLVEDHLYMVEGEWLLQVINSVNFDDYESLQYFQRVLILTGVIDALREAGIQEGDTVSIYEIEFDFVE